MKKNCINTQNKNLKKKYLAPKIELIIVNMEHGLAAGSAAILPTNETGEIKDEWDTLPTKEGEIDW